MIGKIINNYVIDRKLGDGGMGEVYYAKHNKVDREVAIKVLHSHLFFNENIHNRFKNEANALIKLNHPNIVKIFDYVEQDNFACLIMEYINGYTLDEYIAKISGPLTSVKATSIICPVLDAVQYAHDNNVFHRDIKPANIMISKDGSKVRIMDFGIAKLTDSKNFKTTHANTQLGTPFYMSPEQIKGLPFSRMSDIYSLGVTLFEMVTGKCPYHEITSLFDLQSRIVNQPLPLTNEYYPGVSQRIQNAIDIATQKAPELRFQTCSDFSNYLQDNAGSSIPLKIAKPVELKQPVNKINWMTYIIAGFALLAFVVIIARSFHEGTATGNEDNTNEINTSDNGLEINKETEKNAQVLPAPPSITTVSTPVIPTPTIQEQNLEKLNAYFAIKEKDANVSITSKNKEKIINEVKSLNILISSKELNDSYNGLYRIIIKLPTERQIINDFWNNLHQQKYPCRVPFENDSQISGISIDNPFKKSLNPPAEITIVINYTITTIDDESDITHCSVSLNYYKSENKYQLKK